MELSHDLDLSDKLDEVIVVLTESFYMFDGYSLTSQNTFCSVNITEGALSYFIFDLIVY